MKKIFYLIISIFSIYAGIIFLLYPNEIKRELYEICYLWLFKVVLSILPFYLLSHVLLSYPIISGILYKPLDKIFHFECRKSCSLFLLTFITGNPTSSLLIIKSYNDNEISTNEANRLLKISVISSPLFILSFFSRTGILIFIIQIIVSIIIYILHQSEKTYRKTNFNNQSLFQVLDNLPQTMLSILTSMISVGLISITLMKLLAFFKLDKSFIIYFIDILELTTGLNSIQTYSYSNIIKLLLSTFLLSFGGVSIILQILIEIKKTSLSKTSFILYRIIHGIISSIILLLIKLFI